MGSTRTLAVVTILLGVAALVLPYFFGTVAVMALGAIMLVSGIVSLLFVNDIRRQGVDLSVLGPWVQIVAGIVILAWPQLALWLVALILGGGLILSGINGLMGLLAAEASDARLARKVASWAGIVLGVLLIVLGAAGSAVLLGLVLGIALINAGLHQWREADLAA